MNSNVARDMVAFTVAGPTVVPRACQAKVVFADTPNVIIAQMVVQSLSIGTLDPTTCPETLNRLIGLFSHSCARWLSACAASRLTSYFRCAHFTCHHERRRERRLWQCQDFKLTGMSCQEGLPLLTLAKQREAV